MRFTDASDAQPSASGCRASGGQPLVVPVQTAGLADLNDLADLSVLKTRPAGPFDVSE